MNRIKRICALLMAIVLILGVALQPGIGGVFANKTEQTEQSTEPTAEPVTESIMEPATEPEEEPAAEPETDLAELPAAGPVVESAAEPAEEPVTDLAAEPAAEPAEGTAAEPEVLADSAGESEYIYFDLAAGNVRIGANSYSGFVYVSGDPTPREVSSDTRTGNEKFYIYQSNLTKENSVGYYTKTGYETETDYTNNTKCRVPKYNRVKNGTTPWTEFVENNTNVIGVIGAWADAAIASGREETKNYITFDQESGYTADVTIDNIWSSHHPASVDRKTGGIGAHLDDRQNTAISLRLRGDNRVGCVHYSADRGAGNKIEFNDGETGDTPGSITVADFPDGLEANHWNAVIGAADNPPNTGDMSDGIVINSGVIFAGATPKDNCTAIGGGGNNYGSVTINGGTVTAVTAGTGTAIGGGIGYGDQGGDTDVIINDGTIYAYNLGIQKGANDDFKKFVPAAAIGGGGSNKAAGGLTANITITGGTIYAQSMGGPGIGGGGSANAEGGPATINISGGTIIAKSTSGIYGTEEEVKDKKGEKVSAGVSIGGGTGKTGGGSVTLNISKKPDEETIIRAGSIGGGKTTGSGNIGSADVNIFGGDITGQVIMAGGAAKNCTFTMTDGTLHGTNVIKANTITGITDPRSDSDVPFEYLETNGGAVWMEDPNGVANISGGTIDSCTAELGGAIYMNGGTFTLSGTGKISKNTAKRTAATATTPATGGMGGAIYVTGGNANINGGTVSGNKAQIRGGGVYVTGGNVTVIDGTISSNVAGFESSEITLPDNAGRGGGVYLEGAGIFTMTGGTINGNTARYRGGGIFLTKKPTLTKGTISGNIAGNSGGGICVNGDAVELNSANMQIFGNKAQNGGGVAVLNGSFILSGGAVGVEPAAPNEAAVPNTATEKGGGVFVQAEATGSAAEVAADATGSAAEVAASVTVKSGNIWYNTAKNGGGVYLESGDFTMKGETEENAFIRHNTATENGGGVYLKDGNFTMNDETAFISHNTAVNGGGVYLYTDPQLLQGTISENTATGDGGGMYIEDCLVNLKPIGTMTITGNNAKNGAGIFIHGAPTNPDPTPTPPPTVQIDALSSGTGFPPNAVGLLVSEDTTGNLILTKNIATENGGAVCIKAHLKSRFELDTDNVTVTGNSADNGGGVAVLNGNFTMTAGSIGQKNGANTAGYGGGVFVSNGEVWLKGGSVQYNKATEAGGNGGGVCVEGGKFTMTDGSLNDNTAVYNGGGAFVDGEFQMWGGTIRSNTANFGGGFSVNDGNVTIVYGDITHNQATKSGGGAFVSAMNTHVNVLMLSGSLSFNHADEYGGGMTVQTSNISLAAEETGETSGTSTINVEIGCLLDHKLEQGGGTPYYPIDYVKPHPEKPLNVLERDYSSYASFDEKEYQHNSCPEVKENSAGKKGGGFYMDSDVSTLHFFCVEEGNNSSSQGDDTAGMDVEGGKVIVGDEYYHNYKHDDTLLEDAQHVVPWGYISMDDATLVNGGQVDIYGDMTNPVFKDEVTVDIKDKENDHFKDHRRDKNDKSYKVHYFENFQGGGLYQAIQYNEGNTTINVQGALYSHPGYRILGWCTKPVYDKTDPSCYYYQVGTTIDLTDHEKTHGLGQTAAGCPYCGDNQDSNLLVLYAIWEPNGYTVVFDPNVPVGDTYFGSMENQIHQYGVAQQLTKNKYKYSGHCFKGWCMSRNPGNDEKIYADCEEVSNLTDQNGVKIVLYAQWEKCEHTDPAKWTYEVSEDGKTLLRICSCGGQTLKATLFAEDRVYDGHSHPATLTLDDKEAWDDDVPTIAYTKAWLPDGLTHEDASPELSDSGQPFHAGEYTASITKYNTVNGEKVPVTARVEYTIAKAEQEAPAQPNYEITDTKTEVTIKKLDKDPNEFTDEAGKKHYPKAEYCLTYQDAPSVTWEKMADGAATLTKNFENALTHYIIQARYQELEDYNVSDITRAAEVYFFVGNVKVEIYCDIGIECKEVIPDETNHTLNGVDLTLALKNGYYLVGGDYDVTAELKLNNSETSTTHPVTKVPNTNDKYSVKNISPDSTLIIRIGKAKKEPTVTAQVMPGQKFSAFTGVEPTKISRDSAFTAAFQISDFDPGTYGVPKLTFDSQIPAKTTIILLNHGKNGEKSYWYYRAENEVNSVELTGFTEMGGSGEYIVPTAGASGYIDLSYQFIVDFSQCAGSSNITDGYSGESLKMTLEAPIRDSSNATKAPEAKENVTVAMKNSGFTFEETAANGLTHSFTCSFTKGATASKWENRASALVLTPPNDLPPDVQIKAEIGDGTTYLCKNGESFIIPLSLLEAGDKTVDLTLQSALFPAEEKSYTFTAQWLISPSKAGKAPLTGDQTSDTPLDVTFTSAERKLPSLKTSGDYRILSSGETLEVHIEKKNMEGYTISAELQRKSDDGKYEGIGWNQPIVSEDSLSVPLGGQLPGSYCLMLTVKKSGDDSITIVMKVPYYFIIRPTQ